MKIINNSIIILLILFSYSSEIFGEIKFIHKSNGQIFNYSTLIRQADSRLEVLLQGKPPDVVKQMKAQRTVVSEMIDTIDSLKSSKKSLDRKEISFVKELATAGEIEKLADSMKEKTFVIGNFYAGMEINSAVAALSKEFKDVIVSTKSAPTWSSYHKSFMFTKKEDKLNIHEVSSSNNAVKIYDVKNTCPSDLLLRKPKDSSYSKEWVNTSEQIKKAYDHNNKKDDDIVEQFTFSERFFRDNLKLKDDYLILENFIKLLELKYSLKFIENPLKNSHFYVVDSKSTTAIRVTGWRNLNEMSIIFLPKTVVSSDNEELREALNAFD